MKTTIDEKVCLKHHLSPEEALLTLVIRSTRDLQQVLDNLVNREVIVDREGKYYVTQHWSDEMDEILCESCGDEDNEERLLNLAKELRTYYPKGRMPGTSYYYQCNSREIMQKLKKFFTIYGNFPDTEIIDATKRFVASFHGDYKYLPLLKYFIYKDKLVLGEDGQQHVSPQSPLATYLENKNDDSPATASDEWLLTVRN